MMNISTNILKANHVGVRELKQSLSSKVLNKPLVITEHGKPISVNLPFEDLLDLIDLVEELMDPQTVEHVVEGKTAVKAGSKGTPVSHLFNKMRKTKK